MLVLVIGTVLMIAAFTVSCFVWGTWVRGAHRIVEDKYFRDNLEVASVTLMVMSAMIFVVGLITWLVGLFNR